MKLSGKKSAKSRKIPKRRNRYRSAELEKILRDIPRYDPFATAEDCYLDEEAAWQAIEFFPDMLIHVKGELAGQPFHLKRWQKAIAGNLFGWKRPDGTRRYREGLLFVGRKNGKSTVGAGIGLLTLVSDGEPGAEIYSAAAERDQAALIWNIARQQVEANPELDEHCKVYATGKSIVFEPLNASYKAISAEANTKHGYNTHAAIIDELHAHKTSELFDVLMTSTGARRQPLIFSITTSDYDRPSICNDKHNYASKVRDGIIKDKSFLPIIYEASRDDDWTDPKVWKKANPNMGVSISQEYLERECARAQESPGYQNVFKRLHLNIRTEQDVRWLPMEHYDQCMEPFDWEALEGLPCYGGLDLSSTRDLSAFSLYFPESHHVLAWFWIPKDTARERMLRDRVTYPDWINSGHITETPGNVVDYDRIRVDINDIHKHFDIKKIAVDRWNSTQLQTQLTGDGFDVVPFGQGFASMTGPAKELEKLIIAHDLQVGDNPVLRWNASNATASFDAAGNIKPDKGKSVEKIDGIVTTVMAIGLAIAEPEKKRSVYRDRGFRQL